MGFPNPNKQTSTGQSASYRGNRQEFETRNLLIDIVISNNIKIKNMRSQRKTKG